MQPSKITFFERFEPTILSGDKTITIRDEAESHYKIGSTVAVHTLETDRWFCDIKIISVTPIAFSELNESHAKQEHMTLDVLKALIQEIYPNIERLYVIDYRLI